MLWIFGSSTLQLKRNPSCYLAAAAVIHLSLPWSAAGDFSRFTCKGKVTGLAPQAVNTPLPSGITWLYYYWHIVLRQQRHSLKGTYFYFQLYYIYFCLNLFKGNIINPGTRGRKEMEAHNALDNDRKQPVFWQFPQFSSRWSLPKN